MKIRAIIKRPDEQYGHVTNISNTLKNLQRNVGGYIESLTLNNKSGKTVSIILNEEGLIRGLPYNCTIYGVWEIHGDLVVLGVDEDDFTDCPLSFDEWKEMIAE